VNFSFSDDRSAQNSCARRWRSIASRPTSGMAKTQGLWRRALGEMGKLAGSASPSRRSTAGAGLGLVELAIVLEEMGRAAYPALSSRRWSRRARAHAGRHRGARDKWLPAIASGRARMTAALLEEHLDWDPPPRLRGDQSGSGDFSPG